MKKIWIIILAVAILLVGYVWTSYNKLVTLNETADSQWAQVESQYQRRFDLIPNLVNSVKGIFNQEQEVFNNLADARTKYSGATTPNDKAAAAGQVESAFGRLLVIMESYPVLNSYTNIQDLMSQLEGSENRVSVERGRFNETVREYNMIVKRFPGSLIASIFGFSERSYFDAAPGTEVAPTVSF